MSNSTYFPYALAEIYCMVYAITIWFKLSRDVGSEHEITQLRRMIYSYLGMLATDILWALNEDGNIVLPLFLNKVINAVCISCIVLGCYFWFRYIEDRLRLPSTRSRKLYRLFMVPMLVTVSLDFLSIFTGWLFYIDSSGSYQSTDLFLFAHTTVNYFYLSVATVFSIHAARHAKSKEMRSEYFIYSLYMVAPLISGFLEEYFPTVPLLALNIFMVIEIMFLMIQNMQIYNDALTGLNNRKRLNAYLEETSAKIDESHSITLFMLDIDHFKAINDTYGHLEGDNALKEFSSYVKEFSGRYNAFAARYGGDEFCIVARMGSRDPEEFIREFDKLVHDRQRSSENDAKPYLIQASIGYCVANNSSWKPERLINAADEMLYQRKRSSHAGRQF